MPTSSSLLPVAKISELPIAPAGCGLHRSLETLWPMYFTTVDISGSSLIPPIQGERNHTYWLDPPTWTWTLRWARLLTSWFLTLKGPRGSHGLGTSPPARESGCGHDGKVPIATYSLVSFYLCWYQNSTLFLSQSPPHTVTPEQRKLAEAMFMELRKSKRPYNSCKFILGAYSASLCMHIHLFIGRSREGS